MFFSVKANSNLAILSLMKSLGIGADVVSSGEPKALIFDIIFEDISPSTNKLTSLIS